MRILSSVELLSLFHFVSKKQKKKGKIVVSQVTELDYDDRDFEG